MNIFLEELRKIGYAKVLMLENEVYEFEEYLYTHKEIQDYYVEKYEISPVAASMIISGAANNKWSNMLLNELED